MASKLQQNKIFDYWGRSRCRGFVKKIIKNYRKLVDILNSVSRGKHSKNQKWPLNWGKTFFWRSNPIAQFVFGNELIIG